ncbi:MAG TPA: hypothetical protein VHO25_09600, partial [Polyangiaceae bacterium]|nr:hypothetical protein [Polyangiaceae bacterium]
MVSVGAGPCFCAFGWFWDQADENDKCVSYDILDWQGIRSLSEWTALSGQILPGEFQYYPYRHVPHTSVPTQVSEVVNVVNFTGLAPTEIGSNQVVIVPFVLNHIFGKYKGSSEGTIREFANWLLQVATQNTLVIADMPSMSS